MISINIKKKLDYPRYKTSGKRFDLPRKGVSKFKWCFICITILVLIHIGSNGLIQ